ncbi:Uncharacterised protein [Vibrio cholerae]|nr:Uncharacterised protein [Vibrio cholerae]
MSPESSPTTMPIRNGLFTVSSAVHHALMDTQAFATWVVSPLF